MEYTNFIKRILEEIDCWGKDTKVFAILSESRPKQIVDYVFADSPEREDYLYTNDEEFRDLVEIYQEEIGKLEGKQFECLTLIQLLSVIENNNIN
ncbi:hypothetical protein OGZ37_04210 [Lactococcus lactis]|uniref:hypothetical protein n=1 Tax=Lactococcus lactis TaxID=1358 RepID=UPI0024186076|nr:hypothetical protein [Lactococcus lactis]MDG4965783.1 hypothetical protein [Lactococcus lactis]